MVGEGAVLLIHRAHPCGKRIDDGVDPDLHHQSSVAMAANARHTEGPPFEPVSRSHNGNVAMNIDRDMMMRINRIAGIGSIVIGLGIMTAAGIWTMRTWTFGRDAAAARGVVIANIQKEWMTTPQSGGTTTHTSYCALVRYVDGAGKARDYRDDFCFNPPSFRVGDVVTVRYDPENQARIAIDRGNKVYLVPLAVAVVGALCVLGGIQRLAGRGLPPAAPVVPIIVADPSRTL
jgi:hypothetical protein